jgi:hypothetical protein
MIFLLLFEYAQSRGMKTGYSCDPNTTVSYHLFFLLKEIGAHFLGANLIWVVLECRDTGGLAYLHRGTFG